MIVKESFYMRKFCISLAPFFIVKTYIVKTYYFTGQPCWDDIIESTVTGRMQKEHGRAATQWLLQNVYNTHFHTVGDKQQLENEASFCKGPSNCIEEQHDCLIYLIVCFEHSDREYLSMGHFQLFSMILNFWMGHFLSLYTDFDGPFSKLMGLWRMAPCLPNHWNMGIQQH